jgi:inorganic pyrophosphatase
MTARKLLQKAEKLELQVYKKPKIFKEIMKSHVSFTGSLQKHPYRAEQIILVTDPFSANTYYYEFKSKDISYVEELPNLTDPEGNTIPMVRIWLKKKSIGIRCTPFIVEDTKPK